MLVAPLTLNPASANTRPAPQKISTLPTVSGPIPVNDESRPYLSSGGALETEGYVEEEYFLSGEANVYEWAGEGSELDIVAGPGPYTTRILVVRPRDPARFSGNIEVNILNASLNVDNGSPTDFDQMVARGDAWVGISTKPVTIASLKRFDPDRYAPLDWSSPVPEEARCESPTILPEAMLVGSFTAISKPETEDGLVWDMIGQLGLLLKSDERERILPGFSAPRTYLSGVSQSSIYLRTYHKGFHHRYRTPNGKPVYDGYLSIVAPAMARINQCSDDVPYTDPRNIIADSEVPFMSIYSEGEYWLGRYTRMPDSATPKGGVVTYEVAGASHSRIEIPGVQKRAIRASREDIQKSLPSELGRSQQMARSLPFTRNDFIWAPVTRAAYRNLQQWVVEGTMPPKAPFIELDCTQLQVKRDENGNALGGVRLPYIDLPTSTHIAVLSDRGGMLSVMGTRYPFTEEKLKELYPDRAAYLQKFSSSTDKLVADRWILPEDGEAMKSAAAAAQVP